MREIPQSVLLYETVLQGDRCGFGPVPRAEFGVDVGQVPIDGRDGDDQLSGDLPRYVSVNE